MRIDIPDQGKVLAKYGAEAQSLIHCEELAELAQAVSKMRRAVRSGEDLTAAWYGILEEAADVLICMKQMQELYKISDMEIQSMVRRKCLRQEARL